MRGIAGDDGAKRCSQVPRAAFSDENYHSQGQNYHSQSQRQSDRHYEIRAPSHPAEFAPKALPGLSPGQEPLKSTGAPSDTDTSALAATLSRHSDLLALTQAQDRSDSIKRELLCAIRSAETIILDMHE